MNRKRGTAMSDLQRANMWKRISAALFDSILLCIATIGLALLLSTIIGYDSYSSRLDQRYTYYEELYAISLSITEAEYNALPEEEANQYDTALKELSSDTEVSYLYSMMINLTLLIVTFSILFAYLLLEFFVPLLFGNGQTVGKKVFGIGVMRKDGIRLSSVLLFARTILGKFTVETMVPVLIFIMIYFQYLGIGGLAVIGILFFIQIVLLAASHARTPIHDLLAQTVTVDLASQMIFDSSEALLAYKQALHTQEVNRTSY